MPTLHRFLAAVVLVTVVVGSSMAVAEEATVPDYLAERAAKMFAEQGWGSSVLLCRTTLYGPYGNPEAYSYLVYRGDYASPEIEMAVERENIDYLKSVSDKLGTVVIGAARNVFPFLERYEGLPIEIVQKYRAEKIYRRAWGRTENPKFYRFGPGLIVANFSQDKLISNGSSNRGILLPNQEPVLFDLPKERAIKPTVNSTEAIQPEEVWNTLERKGLAKTTLGISPTKSKEISGVPYYLQDSYGGAQSTICMQVATAQILGYWDDHGYDKLINGGGSNYELGVKDMIETLKQTMGWNSTGGTGIGILDYFNFAGIAKFTNDPAYGRNYNFQTDADMLFIWDTIVSEIDAGRPLVYAIFSGEMISAGNYGFRVDNFQSLGHAMTAVGYSYWDIGLTNDVYIVKVHFNYLIDGQNRLLEIVHNTNSILDSREVIKIHPGKKEGGEGQKNYTKTENRNIPDNNSSGITSTITVPDNLTISTTSVTLDITHTYRGDLIVKLTSPSGTTVTLFGQTGGGSDNIKETVAVGSFSGQNAKGNWTLQISDVASQDVGTLNSWSLSFNASGGGGASTVIKTVSGQITTGSRKFGNANRRYVTHSVRLSSGQILSMDLATSSNISFEGLVLAVGAGWNSYVTGTVGGSRSYSSISITQTGDYYIVVSGDNEGATGSYSFTARATPGPLDIGSASKPVVENIELQSAAPSATELVQNYPNPFNAETVIRFTIGSGGVEKHVKLVIYNSLGQEIATIVNEPLFAGRYALRWDGRDSSKREVASGIYLYSIQIGDVVTTKRMMLLK